MSARELAAAGSLHRSSAPTSPVCSTTASTAGRPSTRARDGSFTNPWWRREATDPVTSPSAGTERTTERERQQGSRRAGSAGVANHCTNKCTFLLLVPFCSNLTKTFFWFFFFFKLIYIYILKIEKKNWNYIQICPARKKICKIILFMRLIFLNYFWVLKKYIYCKVWGVIWYSAIQLAYFSKQCIWHPKTNTHSHLIDFFCSRSVAFCFVSSLQSKRCVIGFLFLRRVTKFSIDTRGSRANVNWERCC